ncbi:MAG: hypothetical protein NVS2B12_21050 [Ktedonobacteraceae bacterium]
MSEGQQEALSTVLVFETDPSLRRLITLGLMHHGLHVIEADSLVAIEALDTRTVDVLVLDVDDAATCDWNLLETIQDQPRFASTAAVVLAWEAPLTGSSALALSTRTETTFVPKPFDARALHLSIDKLISARLAEQKAREAQIEAVLLASYSSHTASSAWPLMTAAGLFLLVVGLLLQVVLAIVGGLIVVAALLLWTLGGPPASTKMGISTS